MFFFTILFLKGALAEEKDIFLYTINDFIIKNKNIHDNLSLIHI